VFDPANSLSTLGPAEAGTVATEVYMNSNSVGQLTAAGAGASTITSTARLIKYLSANAIIVELLV
jgi:hypothetical protein